MKQIDTKEFFETQYVGFTTYDNIRKIANAVDGLKNASRKVLHYTLTTNVKDFVKVSNLGPRIQDATQYLHGSLEGVVVNVAADYTGANNVNLLIGDGNFGKRFVQEASASRYISAKLNPIMREIFVKDDDDILEHQVFEGDPIEPKFYVPVLPLLAINGSEGMSVGFAQKILPRNPLDIIEYLVGNKKTLVPWFKGFKGTIVSGENENQWAIKGAFERISRTQLMVTELPVGYDLKGYVGILDGLVEKRDIKEYEDLSDDDIFKFQIAVTREFSDLSDDEIMEKLKLVKRVSENYTAVDIDNRVKTFDNIYQIIDYWTNIRLEYNDKRKDRILLELNKQKDITEAKAKFIGAVINNRITINKKSKSDIETQITEYDQTLVPYIPTLMGMPLWSLTVEKIQELQEAFNQIKTQITHTEKLTNKKMMQQDIKDITKTMEKLCK